MSEIAFVPKRLSNESLAPLTGGDQKTLERIAELEAHTAALKEQLRIAVEALEAFRLLTYPVSQEINPKGFSWRYNPHELSETLEYVKELIDIALQQIAALKGE